MNEFELTHVFMYMKLIISMHLLSECEGFILISILPLDYAGSIAERNLLICEKVIVSNFLAADL